MTRNHHRQPQSGFQGRKAEQLAEQFLQQQGLSCRARNYRRIAGEIDLIMDDGDTLVFVEVRFRSNPCFGLAAETVNWQKQKN